jgi:hypothetical protein
MSLLLPNPTQDPGPDWAQLIYNAMNAGIDQHDHSPGKGVQITPAGMNISSALPMNDNQLTNAQLINLYAQGSTPTLPGSIFRQGVDLYYIDGAANVVRITQSGSVTGSSGTITGLPSGTASASFAGAAFTFQSATSTPAAMNVGPLNIGAQTAGANTVTLEASASQSSNIAFTLPLALPASAALVSCDSAGNLGTALTTGSGNAVLATSPTIVSPALTTPAISGGTSSGQAVSSAAITASNIDSTIIGGTTPYPGSFSAIQIGASGPLMKSQRFTGTGLAPSSSVTLLTTSSYSTYYGCIGKTNNLGNASLYYPLDPGNGTNGCTVVQSVTGNDIIVFNNSGTHQNNYDVTLFYD